MKLWRKDGKLILTRCNACPCSQGCRYTYYVDHGRSESGDGHSWETAFKSVSDVFANQEIHNFRNFGCIIYVKIRGDITYSITGLYAGYAYPEYIWLQPEAGRVTCNISNVEIAPYGGYFVKYIVFDRWDITWSDINDGCVVASGEHVIFSDCTFNLSVTRNGSEVYARGLFGHLGYSEMRNCSISGNVTGRIRIFTVMGSPGLIVSNTTIDINDSRDSVNFCNLLACDDLRNCIFENVSIQIVINVIDVRFYNIIGFGPNSQYPSVFDSCGVSWSGPVNHGHWETDGYSWGEWFCAFDWYSGQTTGATFINCSQNCHVVDSENSEPDFCGDDCAELS